MIKYTVYKTNGEIIRTGTAMTEATANLQGSAPGTYVILEGSDPKTEVVKPGPSGPIVVTRQPMGVGTIPTSADKTTFLANGIASMLIQPIPIGATCQVYLPTNLGLIQPDDFVVNDGQLVVTTTVPGIYSLRLSYQDLMDFEVTFNAT